MPILSAVIATRDRPDLLDDCIASLMRQQADAGTFEVIVVDDGSEPPLDALVSSYADGPVPVRWVRQEPAGLQAARNTGLDAARGEIVAFLDDDTLVAPTWAAGVVIAFERFGCDGLAGRIQLQLEGPEPAWLGPRLRGYLSERDFGPRARILEKGEPYGANCAVTAAAARRLDGFRAGLDRTGRSLISNGEIEFFRRLRDQGGVIAYAPDASVLHRVPAERLTPEWFKRRAYAQGLSDVLMAAPQGRAARWRRGSADVLQMGLAPLILAKNLAQGRGTVSAQAWTALYRGRLAGLRSGAG